MKKRFFTILFLTIISCVCVFSFFACDMLGEEEKHEHKYLDSIINPTCTEQGYTVHTCSCGKEYKDNYVNSTGHNYNTATYQWNGQNCTATRVCKNDISHIETETVTGVYVKDTDATCLTCEKGHYKATFLNSAFTEQNTASNSVNNGIVLGHSFTNYVSDKNATYESDGTKTAHCNHLGCSATDTITDEGSKLLHNGINFKTLNVSNDNVNGKLPNGTTQFSFINEVDSSGTATYKVCTDLSCTNEIPSKTVSLQTGDNTFYILADNTDNGLILYTVTLRVKPMYTVTFNVNGGSNVASQTVEEDTVLEKPTTAKTGYTFVSWDYDFTAPISDNISITANWMPIVYTITYNLNGGTNDKNNPATYTIESETITLRKPTKLDSVFISWSDDGTVLKGSTGDKSFTATWKKQSEGLEFYLNSDDTYIVSGIGTCTDSEIIIPAYHNGNLVTSIGSNAFKDCSSLTGITIPDTVTSIESSVFSGCSSLTSVTIPNSVTSIGNYAFNKCSSLTNITIPNSVTSIGYGAFYYCTSLTSITISDSITSIRQQTFYACKSLTSITIPDSVTRIEDYAFSECTSLTKVNYLGTIDGWCMISFSSYGTANPLYYAKKLYINNELVREAKITTATKINAHAFSNCTSLTSVEIGDSVIDIEERAFAYCSSLANITFGKNITTIGKYAFSNCTSLTSITIPDSVKYIKMCAFDDCSSLKTVKFTDTTYWYYINKDSDLLIVTDAARNALMLTGEKRYHDWEKREITPPN